MILVIDNYDSFTYNLVQYLGELSEKIREQKSNTGKVNIKGEPGQGAVTGIKTEVFRNDAITFEEIEKLAPEKIVLSPGPGNPDGAGICLEIVRGLGGKIPLLGVCLGHQVIGQAFGGEIISAKKLMHGMVSEISHDGCGIFSGLENPFIAARYHSLAIDPKQIPGSLQVTATAEDGEVMGLKHREYPFWGIQFHPESILTGSGKLIIENFLRGEDKDDDHYRNNCLCG